MNTCVLRVVSRASTALASVIFAVAALAQTPPPLSQDRVTFYTEPNFKGEAITIEAGAAVDNLDQYQRANQQPWTFAISSVRVEGAATASVFSAAGFNGDRLEIRQSIPDLYGQRRGADSGGTWDRAIASINVVGPQTVAVAPPPPVAMVPAPTAPPPQSAPVIIVPTQPQAPTQQVVVVQPRPEPPPTVVVVPSRPAPPPVVIREVRPRMDRRTAEMIVTRAYREVLNRPPDPEGLATYRDRLMHEGWTERQIVEQLQRSGEARGTNADDAIRQAYREVLGREPDAAGLAHYRAKWKDGWTQGQIRADLARSKEGSESYARTVITRAYRELLGRDPDPSGLATYEKAMRERGYTERDVRAALMSGDEYRRLHPRR